MIWKEKINHCKIKDIFIDLQLKPLFPYFIKKNKNNDDENKNIQNANKIILKFTLIPGVDPLPHPSSGSLHPEKFPPTTPSHSFTHSLLHSHNNTHPSTRLSDHQNFTNDDILYITYTYFANKYYMTYES